MERQLVGGAGWRKEGKGQNEEELCVVRKAGAFYIPYGGEKIMSKKKVVPRVSCARGKFVATFANESYNMELQQRVIMGVVPTS